MTATMSYSCNLCFNQTHRGYTICYMQDNDKPGKYHLSSVNLGLSEMKDQISAGGAMISHICENCAEEIYGEVFENKPKAKAKTTDE